MSAATGNGAGSGSGSGGGRTFASAALAEAGDVAAPQLVCVCESSVLDKLLALDAANARVKLLNLRTGRARTLHRVDAGFTPVRIDRLREERYALFQLRADGSGLVILLEEQLRPKIVAFWKCVPSRPTPVRSHTAISLSLHCPRHIWRLFSPSILLICN